MVRQKHKGRECEGKVGVGCSDPRPVGLAPVDFAMPRRKKFLEKMEELILFRLLITRILIWKAAGTGVHFLGGGRGGGLLLPLRMNTRLTAFHPSLFSTEFFTYQYLAVIGKFLFGFLRWIVCAIVSCVAPTVLQFFVVKFVHFINIFDHQNDFSSAPPLCLCLALFFGFIFFVFGHCFFCGDAAIHC